MQRRSFLKTLGGALGTLVLSSCGSSDGGANFSGSYGGNLPSGYQFTPLLDNQGNVPVSSRRFGLASFPGTAILNDLGQVFVHADDEAGVSYLLKLQLEGSLVTSQETVAWQGMDLPDGLRLTQLDLASTNDRGQLVFRGVLSNQEHGYYLQNSPGQNLRVLGPRRPAPGSDGVFGHIWGDFQLLDDGALLLIGAFTGDPKKTLVTRSGLFHLPNPGQSEGGQLLLASGDLLPGTQERIGRLGLVDGDGPEGHFVQQVGLARARLSAGEVPDGTNRSVLMSGRISGAGQRLVTLDPSMVVSEALSSGLFRGQVSHGGRVGMDGTVTGVVETESGQHFFYASRVVLREGQLSPLGFPIMGFSGPVIGPAGAVAGHLFTQGGGEEIFVSNGQETRTILSSGTRLAGKTIAKMAFGLVRDQVDQNGRIVLFASFTDKSQALLLGQPV